MIKQDKHPRDHIQASAIGAMIDVLAAEGNSTGLMIYLPETYTGYSGRSSAEIKRIRGYAMAAFERTALPDVAVPFMLDELENGMDPYNVAGAAIGLRGLTQQHTFVKPYLLKGFYNMLLMDDAISFRGFDVHYPLLEYTTPVREILITIQVLQIRDSGLSDSLKEVCNTYQNQLSRYVNDLLKETIELLNDNPTPKVNCCEFLGESYTSRIIQKLEIKRKMRSFVKMEDQDAKLCSYNDAFLGKISVLVFFYTRCDNPNKCARTISQFAELQKLLDDRGINNISLAGITYDASYDIPLRLRNFGINRGFRFNAVHRFFRVVDGFDILRSYLNLEVNYAGSIVNNHSIELYILDKRGKAIMAQTRLQWQPEEVADILASLQSSRYDILPAAVKNIWRVISNTIIGILIAFFPKCPVCWAGYMSLFSAIGLQSVPYSPKMLYIILVGMALSLFINFRISKKKKIVVVFYINLLGSVSVLAGYLCNIEWFTFTGIFLLLISAAYINLSGLINPFINKKSNNVRYFMGK